MENGNNKVEVIIHVDDSLDDARRNGLTGALEQHNGIYAAERDFTDGQVSSERLQARIAGAVRDLAPWLARK